MKTGRVVMLLWIMWIMWSQNSVKGPSAVAPGASAFAEATADRMADRMADKKTWFRGMWDGSAGASGNRFERICGGANPKSGFNFNLDGFL
jgi:hypothetical protein